jgi:hypothetical protein
MVHTVELGGALVLEDDKPKRGGTASLNTRHGSTTEPK